MSIMLRTQLDEQAAEPFGAYLLRFNSVLKSELFCLQLEHLY